MNEIEIDTGIEDVVDGIGDVVDALKDINETLMAIKTELYILSLPEDDRGKIRIKKAEELLERLKRELGQ